jgi:large subunit ribosomal protein L25
MDELILMAEPRTVVGKKVKRLRREGLVPGVVYGPGLTAGGTVQVSVNRREFDRFFHAHGHTTLFTIQWDGGRQQVFIREVQEDPVKRVALHIDFFSPNLQKELVASTPVVLRHLPDHHQGVLTQVRAAIDVSALPTVLPHEIAVDASNLVDVGDTLRVGDVVLPPGVTLVTPADEMIALIVAETVEEVEEVEEIAAEAEEAAPEIEKPAAEADASQASGEESSAS